MIYILYNKELNNTFNLLKIKMNIKMKKKNLKLTYNYREKIMSLNNKPYLKNKDK